MFDKATVLDMNVRRMAEDEDLILELSDKNKYKFVKFESIPDGYYVSEIMYASKSITKAGKPAYDICYDLIPYTEVCRFLCDNNVDKDALTRYFARVRYELYSDSDEAFRDAMYLCGFDKKVSIKETIGTMEIVKLDYPYKSSLGNIEFVTVYDEDAIISNYSC